MFLILVSVACSLFLATYVLLVGNFLAHQPESNTIEQTALDAATVMSRTTITSDGFGAVGLSDIASDEYSNTLGRPLGNKITSINSLYGVLRLDAMIANRLHHPKISALLAADFGSLRQLETGLSKKLYKGAEKRPVATEKTPEIFGLNRLTFQDNPEASQVDNFIYQRAYRYLAHALAVHDSKLLDLSIKLGFVRSRKAVSAVKAPDLTETMSVDETGDYRPGVPVPVPNFEPIMFTPLLNQTGIIDPADFVQDSRRSAPSAILVEAVWEFRPIGHKTNPLRVKRTACAAVGSSPLTNAPAALIINFPHGKPNLFNSVGSMLFYQGWRNPGFWRQALDGDVPGHGSLSEPKGMSLKEGSPGDALAVLLYHWMRLLEPNSNVENCIDLIWAAWPSPSQTPANQTPGSAIAPPVNSCLARDGEARSSAILDQSYPGGLGQTALNGIFAKSEVNLSPIVISAPPSAIPLFVDRSGNINLAGQQGFNQKFVEEFWDAIYDTNLAALESLWAAKLMSTKSSLQKPEIEQKALREKEELSSLNSRINRLSTKTAGGDDSRMPIKKEYLRETALLTERVGALQEAIAKDKAEINRLNKLSELSAIAVENARRAADATFDLCAHSFILCRNGIVPLEGQGYLVGRKTCFFPKRKPLSESDFREAAQTENSSDDDAKTEDPADQSWLKRGMWVRQDVEVLMKSKETAMLPLANKIKQLTHDPLYVPAFSPICVVLDSQAVKGKRPIKTDVGNQPKPVANRKQAAKPGDSGAAIKPDVYTVYPFANIFLPNGQLLYYCQRAVETGQNPAVSWSVLVRDLVATKGAGRMGTPVNSMEPEWCRKQGDTLGLCPGLACEFQVRTPLPKLTNFPASSYVSDEAGQQIPQLPPVPAEML